MHCKDGRAIELNVVVTVAPGVLAKYTSIIRILPRYAIVNNLPYPVRIWQDSSTFRNVGGNELTSKKASKWRYSAGDEDGSKINQYELLWGRHAVLNERQKAPNPNLSSTAARRSALYIATVYPSEIVPFCLPDSRGERQLRIDPGNPWDLSGSISTSKPGDFTLAIKQAVDSKAISHESSRASPHYEVRLPPHGTTSFDEDLGIWFESEYGSNTGLIVKAIRKKSYCFNETEVHVGDELLCLNGIPLTGLPFDESIDMLKRHLLELSSRRKGDGNIGTPVKQGRNSVVRKSLRYQREKDQPQQVSAVASVVLTFRTVEERIRHVMIKAATTDTTNYQSLEYSDTGNASNVSRNGDKNESGFFIKAELKNYPRSHLGLFLVLREESTAPYELLNQSVMYTIYFRQRECSHLKWQSLKPGESRRYAWDEPLKPKKLIVRVDSQNVFAHKGNSSISFQASDASIPLRSEEDVYYPKVALVPLDEVGYHELLSLHDSTVKNGNLNLPFCCLQFDVDVSRNYRVLVVRDVPSVESHNQMTLWLGEFNEQLQHEEKRRKDLHQITNCVTESNTALETNNDYNRMIEACNLLDSVDHDNAVISGCHQILVEILEATGISSDSINASCNPYCDVRLKHGQNRNRFLGTKDRHRTYYIRKTFTPVWKKQTFVFHVPPEAAVVTRGYRLIVRVRNYSPFRSHQILGYARLDLHSVRDQNSHMGWFPLVGRNGRPELNTHGSHLGRGSVKVRVQWIYTMPALVQYLLLLSESRIVAIKESIDVVANQLERLVESENETRAGQDGIQAVRIGDLLSFPKYKRKENIDNLRLQKVKASMVKKSVGPLLASEESLPLTLSTDSQDRFTELPVLLRPHTHERGFKKTANSLHAVAYILEKQISKKRLQRLNTARQPLDDILNATDGLIPLSLIRSWNVVQALFTDADFEAKFNGDFIKATPRSELPSSDSTNTLQLNNSEVTNGISLKLLAPENAPTWIQTNINVYIDEWIQSRSRFDRTARVSMNTVLHSGGWLSIRPITALNLPDVFTGMAVKIQYGSETYTSDTADVRSLDPSWYKINRRDSNVDDWELVSHNDIHIHIAPQLTSGTIRLSVIGEKKHKRPSSKTEIGVVHLPLGATISCLLDCEESHMELLRWFPLSTSTARMEGDGGLNVRPPDTEKESDSDFKEYFAPCIQLALFWSPDNGNVFVNNTADGSPNLEGQKRHIQDFTEVSRLGTKRHSTFVKNYLNADIGWISAALIDSQRACELLSLNVKDIDLRYFVTSAKTRMGLTVGWLQIDYQDNDEREPVILSPTPTGLLSPVIQTLVVKDNLRSETDTLSFDFIDISIAEFDFTVEERLLIDLMKFLSSLHARQKTRMRTNTLDVTTTDHPTNSDNLFILHNDGSSAKSFASVLMSKPNKLEKKEKIYIKELVIGIIKVNISYLKGRTRDAAAESSLRKVLKVASDELFQRFFYNEDTSDPYLAWSQSTFDDDLKARNEG